MGVTQSMSINGYKDPNGLILPSQTTGANTAPTYVGSNGSYQNFQTQNINGSDILVGVNPDGTQNYLTTLPQEQSALSSGLEMGGNIIGAGSSLMNAYTGWKGLQLAEDQFDFSKASTNRDVANQAKIINNEYANRNEVGLALGGGAMTADEIATSKANVSKKYVDGSAIG